MKTFLLSNKLTLTAAALIFFAATGCGRDEVKVYKADAGDAALPVLPPPAAAATMPAPMSAAGLPAPDNSGLPALKYVLPDGWKEKPASQFRVASFEISENGKTVDISVVPLPLGGMTGDAAANVTRWRGLVGLPPVTEDEAAKLAEKISVGGQPADLYDLTGDAQRIIASVLHREGTAWFFKITGESALVEKNKPAFIEFLKSVEFGGLAAPSTMDMSQLPPSHPAIPGMDVAAPAVPAGDKPTWTVPAGWSDAPLTQFLIAKFSVSGADGAQASVNVSSLDKDGGGLAPNVTRWRGQIGLPPIGEILSTEFEVPGGKATEVDYTGTDMKTGKPARLVGVMVPQSGATWFYKLMGDEKIVAAQKDAFVKFIQSAKYPDVH